MTANDTLFEEPNLQALLEKIAKDESFQQPRFSISNGSKPGQNFIGRVYRVVITENQDGEEKTLSLIFKASSTNRERHEMISGDKLFRTESEMYQVVLPTLNNFLKKHGVVDSPIFPGTPRCLAVELNHDSEKDVADVLVFEDKKVDGFGIVSLKTGLNGEQCRLALKRVALLHATSMALYHLEPETAERMKNSLDRKYKVGDFRDAFTDLYRSFSNGLEMLGEPYTPGNPVYDSLNKNFDDFCNEFMKRFEFSTDIFCITHNDCSSNNIMFKLNDDGSTEDACLIDFQTAAVSSPANDLATLLIFCTKKEVRNEHLENLLQFYHDEVSRILKAFGCDPDTIFPWDLYQSHLKRFMKFGVIFSLMGLPVLLAETTEFVDIHSEKQCGNTLFTDAKVTNPETLMHLKQRLHDAVFDGGRYGYL